MPQIRINIKDNTYEKLKKAAENNYRTIAEEINYRLSCSFQSYNTLNELQTSTPTPENPTGQNHTPTANTTRQPDFQELAKQILGHRLNINEEYLEPDNRYYEYAKPAPNTIMRFPDTMPYDKQIEYLEEYKHYE